MEPDEARAEIERRRKRAVDLKLRETLWTLYYCYLSPYAKEEVEKDPEMVYPEIRETLEVSRAYGKIACVQFRIGEITYRVDYKEGPTSGSPGSNFDGTTRTPVTLGLGVDEKRVFDFKMTRIVHYTPEMPLFDETMGDVTSFIEGPWVTEVAELLQKIQEHQKSVRDKRRAPKLQQKLREDMKRFGL